jgi:hypothetical protein
MWGMPKIKPLGLPTKRYIRPPKPRSIKRCWRSASSRNKKFGLLASYRELTRPPRYEDTNLAHRIDATPDLPIEPVVNDPPKRSWGMLPKEDRNLLEVLPVFPASDEVLRIEFELSPDDNSVCRPHKVEIQRATACLKSSMLHSPTICCLPPTKLRC